MFENIFTELDNDFITIWSKILLLRKKDGLDIFNDLERLAELGQVNAVQAYYSVLKQGDYRNSVIDKIVDDFPDGDFDFLLAKTYKKQHDENYKILFRSFFKSYFSNDYENQLKVKKQMMDLQSFQLLCKTKQMCLEQYNKTKDPIILERFFEIASGSTPWANLEEKEIFKKYNFVRKNLVSKLQENPDNLQILFALGKNLYFSSLFTLFPKTKQGKQILLKLKSRPYSKTLQKYINECKKGDSQKEK